MQFLGEPETPVSRPGAPSPVGVYGECPSTLTSHTGLGANGA